MSKFKNYITGEDATDVNDVTELKGGSWYIKLGFAGFNSPSNNAFGYKSQIAAVNAVKRYQSK